MRAFKLNSDEEIAKKKTAHGTALKSSFLKHLRKILKMNVRKVKK